MSEIAPPGQSAALADLAPVLEPPSNEVVPTADEAGTGATVISERIVAVPGGGTLVHDGFDPTTRDYTVPEYRQHFPNRIVDALRQIMDISMSGGEAATP